ncbi:MAG: hypothetical protein IKP26_08840 [Clostridia bacterium]|jgi:hypothetical protein|nr:hypothetical protein [Clostridia bacterium]
MKRAFTFILLLSVLLTGCARPPEEDAHPEWDGAWLRMGDVLAAEQPEGFEFNESNDVLSISGLYYATWTAGEGREITNPQGREARVYDAQIYLLLKEGKTEGGSKADIADWIKREKASYETEEERTVTVNGQEFTLLSMTAPRNENPYHHGISVFALRGTNAITVELLCAEGCEVDAEAVMLRFLEGLHY